MGNILACPDRPPSWPPWPPSKHPPVEDPPGEEDDTSSLPLKNIPEPDIPEELRADVWKTSQALSLSLISFTTGIIAFACGPTVQSGGLMAFSGAHFALSLTELEYDGLLRGLNAMAFTSGVVVLFPWFPPNITVRAVAAVSISSCLLNEVRACVVDRQQAKGAAQVGILIPAVVAIRHLYAPGLFPWHPIMMVAGITSIAIGVSIQLSGRKNWTHSALASAGAAGMSAGLAIIIANKVIYHLPHMKSVHDWVSGAAMTGTLFQVILAIPTMWPGLKPNERSFVDTHHALGKLNLVLMTGAMITGFGKYAGYGAPITIVSIVVSSSIAFVLVVPGAWSALKLKDASV
jgi:hypothetical protein